MTGKLSNVCFQLCVKRKKRTRRYEMLCFSLLYLLSLLPRMTLYGKRHHLLSKGGSSKVASLNCIQLKTHSFCILLGPLSQVKTLLQKDPWVFESNKWIRLKRPYRLSCPQGGHPRRVGKIISGKGLT